MPDPRAMRGPQGHHSPDPPPAGHLRKPTFLEIVVTGYAILQGLQWLGVVGLTKDVTQGALAASSAQIAELAQDMDAVRGAHTDLQWMIKAQVETNAWQTQMLQEHRKLLDEVRRELQRLP